MIKGLIHQIRLTYRLLRDPRVPLWVKAIPFLPLIYLVSPIDILPDFIPVIGQLDDLTLIVAGMRLFEAMAPEYIAHEHRQAIEGSERPLEVVESTARQPGDEKRKR
ncbi:MAG: DUF1232 domain-containing protein [Anaerolineae bacterium]|nr:DUF1232 domain-containing protein [Anaerolineae bacterium]